MVDTRRLEQLLREKRSSARPAGRGPRSAIAQKHGANAQVARAPGRDDALRAAWAALPEIATPPARGRGAGSAATAAVLGQGPVGESFDLLRAQLLQALRTRGWRSIGITAPVRGCGASFVSLSLARSFARLDNVRAALLDLDLETGALATRLGATPEGQISDLIAGDLSAAEYLCRMGRNLALGLTAPCPEGAATLFHNDALSQTLGEIADEYSPDVILCDLPPLLTEDSTLAALPSLDGVLIVADGTRTQARDLSECERLLQDRTQLLGVVLNRGLDTVAARRAQH